MPDTRYRPPTRVVSREIPFRTIVQQVDPDWQRDRHRELEYEFSGGRRFYGDPDRRGPYSDS